METNTKLVFHFESEDPRETELLHRVLETGTLCLGRELTEEGTWTQDFLDVFSDKLSKAFKIIGIDQAE